MKKIAPIVLTLLLFSNTTFGQTDLAPRYKELYNKGKYGELIKYKPRKGEELTAKAIYYIAMSYFMMQEDENALKYFDIAIAKGPVDHDMYFYKGKTLYYQQKYRESLPLFDEAIKLLPDEPDFYAGKGEALYALKQKEDALICFSKAISLPNCSSTIFQLAGELYKEMKDYPKAIAAYQGALKQMENPSKDYQITLFNIGLNNQLAGNIQEANQIFEQIVADNPNDFQCMAKLIQTYYSLNQIEKAKPYKEKLYAAHEKQLLPNGMKDMFCFDQFVWNEKRVMAFETFEETNEVMFAKHHFYVLDNTGKIEYRIDSESSAAIRMSGPQHKYVLCLVKGTAHFTYYQYVFNDDFKYDELKANILDILNEKVKPDASFLPGDSQH